MDTEISGSLSAGTPQPGDISRPYKDLQSTVTLHCSSLPLCVDLSFPSWLTSTCSTTPLGHSWFYTYLFDRLLWEPVESRKNLPQYRRCLGLSGHTVWRVTWTSLPWQCTCVHQVRNPVPLGKEEHGSSSHQKASLPTLCCCWTSATAQKAAAPQDNTLWGNSPQDHTNLSQPHSLWQIPQKSTHFHSITPISLDALKLHRFPFASEGDPLLSAKLNIAATGKREK